jgi:predicted nucleotide-binding protein
MAIEYAGSAADIKTLLAGHGIEGEWSTDGNGKHVFRAKKGGVVNFWDRTGRVQCQGSTDRKLALEALLSGDAVVTPTGATPSTRQNITERRTKIFVVHGHDQTALEQLELVLRRLNLDPYILQNNDGQSKTIIEALEQQIYREAAFGIILMTPDDFGYSKSKGEQERQPRARQNVVLEMGMVFASLGRERMVILKKGALEIPSDIDGVLRLEFNDHVKEVAVKLANRMKNAGIEIDDSLIHRAGA